MLESMYYSKHDYSLLDVAVTLHLGDTTIKSLTQGHATVISHFK